MQNGAATLADCLALSYKAKHTITVHNSATRLLGICSKDLKIYSHKKLHTDVYRSLIHNSKTWEQPRYSSVVGWINKLWYIQVME